MIAHAQHQPLISVLIPVYNSEGTIGRVVHEVREVLRDFRLEFVLVNDGSRDGSHEVCLGLSQTHPLTYVQLAKNYGEHNAVMAGLNQVRGDYTIIMDDDFQNPPAELLKIIARILETGDDVVYTHYAEKKHSFLRNLGSRFNHAVSELLIDKPRGLYLSSFKIINRFIVDELVKYQGPFPYIDGLIMRSTNRISTLLVAHSERQEGRSGYTLRKLVRLWLNMSVNFSVLPLRISSLLGLGFSLLGALLSVLYTLERLLYPDIPAGWTTTIISVMIFSGIQLIILGIFGEYMGKLYLTLNQTPQYTVRTRVTGKATD